MAKGQKRSGREPKKAKKKQVKIVAPTSIFDDSRHPAKGKPASEPGPARP